jgi:hypothetical protein
MLIHLAAALAVWAIGLPAQHWRARGGLKIELAHMGVNDREVLLCEHRALGQTQSVNLAFLGSGPWPEITNCSWQLLKSVRALGAEEMQHFVFVGAPDLKTHAHSFVLLPQSLEPAARHPSIVNGVPRVAVAEVVLHCP